MIAYISKKPYNACFIQEIPVVITVNNKKCFSKKKKKKGIYDRKECRS